VSQAEVERVLARALADDAFLDQMLVDSTATLAEYDLSPEERTTLSNQARGWQRRAPLGELAYPKYRPRRTPSATEMDTYRTTIDDCARQVHATHGAERRTHLLDLLRLLREAGRG
jgi:hypothetical protein